MADSRRSEAWMEDFDECKSGVEDVFAGMGPSDAMNRGQLKRYIELMAAAGFDLHHMDRSGAGYDGMQHGASILCRWPRPRELGRWAAANKWKMNYFRVIVTLGCDGLSREDVGKAAAEAVGKLGANFNDISARHDLMYMWMHEAEGCRTVMLYGVVRSKVDDAAKAVAALAESSGFAGASIGGSKSLRLSPQSKDFAPPGSEMMEPVAMSNRAAKRAAAAAKRALPPKPSVAAASDPASDPAPDDDDDDDEPPGFERRLPPVPPTVQAPAQAPAQAGGRATRRRRRGSSASSASSASKRSKAASPRRARAAQTKRSAAAQTKRSKAASPRRARAASPKRSKAASPRRARSAQTKRSKAASPRRARAASPKRSKAASPKRARSPRRR